MNSYNYLYLGFYIHEILKVSGHRDPNNFVQTERFAKSIFETILLDAREIYCFSFYPVSTYPISPYFKFSSSAFVQGKVRWYSLGFVNLRILRIISRVYSLIYQVVWHRGYVKRLDRVVVHGVHFPHLLVAYLLKFFLDVKVIVYLTDPAGVTLAHDGILTRFLRKFELGIVKRTIRNFDVQILLSSGLVDYYEIDSLKSIVFPGFFRGVQGRTGVSSGDVFKIGFAGTISERYGINVLHDSLKSLRSKEFVIEVAGIADRSIRAKYPGLVYRGFLSSDDYVNFMNSCDVFVCPRDPHSEFTRFSFPSKIFEYISFLRPVISFELPCYPEDIKSEMKLVQSYNGETLAKAIQEVKLNYSNYSKSAYELAEWSIKNYSSYNLSIKINKIV